MREGLSEAVVGAAPARGEGLAPIHSIVAAVGSSMGARYQVGWLAGMTARMHVAATLVATPAPGAAGPEVPGGGQLLVLQWSKGSALAAAHPQVGLPSRQAKQCPHHPWTMVRGMQDAWPLALPVVGALLERLSSGHAQMAVPLLQQLGGLCRQVASAPSGRGGHVWQQLPSVSAAAAAGRPSPSLAPPPAPIALRLTLPPVSPRCRSGAFDAEEEEAAAGLMAGPGPGSSTTAAAEMVLGTALRWAAGRGRYAPTLTDGRPACREWPC
jgi:hypothetical protein